MDENQLEFSEHCGINVETLSLIEREKSAVRLSTAQKIAAYTGLAVSQLFAVEDQDTLEEEKTS